ncbi:protein Wnt-8b-like [Lytechinus pictus]|uniref:protein Wnt-8b-like n=1 Tax=Lytechinus pictus TaxID=7653 RepID=UPI00240E2C92|nr:protein Wnt-8b-like [Lytechinus pictus]
MDIAAMFVRHLLLIVLLLVNVPVFQAIIWSPASNVLLAGSKRHITYIDSVSAGIQNAVQECQFQFKWDKWNCPEASVFTNTQANREMSFVQAIASAGVMYSLTKNCSQGAFDDCGCDHRRNGDTGGEGWTWGGCSDNVRFGERMAEDIMDDAEKSEGAVTVMNMHNNEAGRKAVKQTLQRTCKCHGVSGSCSLQTCWNHVANFRVIGDEIKRKYFKAVRVDFVSGKLIDGNRAADDRFPRTVMTASLNRRDLVFLDQSPDYCRANLTIGISGTAGRECMVREDVEVSSSSFNKESPSSFRWVKQSCSRLCRSCGMEIRKTEVVITSSCNCNFVWCCQVKCDTCRRTVTRRTCHPVGSALGR